MFAIRREDARNWPCPWVCPDDSGVCSRPQPWDLTKAKAYVDKHRSSDCPDAVYYVRGFWQKKVWPIGGTQ